MGNHSKWSLLALLVVPLTFAASARRPPQSERSITTQSVAVQASNEQDDWDVETKKILQTANSWRTGDPIPPALRRFRQYGSDIPTTMDSDSLMAQVQNLSLLATIVLDPDSDSQCREDAFSQGTEVGGPNQFFELLRPQLLLPLPRIWRLGSTKSATGFRVHTPLSMRYSLKTGTCLAKKLLVSTSPVPR